MDENGMRMSETLSGLVIHMFILQHGKSAVPQRGSAVTPQVSSRG